MQSEKIDQQKKYKRDILLAAAFDLFVEKGPGGTAIDDIVRRAGVAKGTFYLYFHDRNEILRHIVAQKGALLVREAYSAALERSPSTLGEEILFTIEEVWRREEKSPKLLTLIYKNSSWSLIAEVMNDEGPPPGSPLARLVAERGRGNAEALMFMVSELVSSVAYNAIVLGEPAGISSMRDHLLAAVARLMGYGELARPARKEAV
jgi:AcrR family transcriptional regulator